MEGRAAVGLCRREDKATWPLTQQGSSSVVLGIIEWDLAVLHLLMPPWCGLTARRAGHMSLVSGHTRGHRSGGTTGGKTLITQAVRWEMPLAEDTRRPAGDFCCEGSIKLCGAGWRCRGSAV